mmetsp:Transcript_27795/g.41846  ORF Transcript_27795/g.41846 Transcript_27795/m.41846 type:complete len:89 (+) Transcript_27795:202-468(+)
MQQKETMGWISMHHLVGTDKIRDCRGEFSALVRMSRAGLEGRWRLVRLAHLTMVEDTKEALPHELSCCSYSAVKLLCGESVLKIERNS